MSLLFQRLNCFLYSFLQVIGPGLNWKKKQHRWTLNHCRKHFKDVQLIQGHAIYESEHLKEDSLNWTFWKTRIIPYLKGSRLWPYISGSIPKPTLVDSNKLANGKKVRHKLLSMILMNIVQMCKQAWTVHLHKPLGRSVKLICASRPIMQNLAQTCLYTKHFMEGSMESLPAHIAKLQRLREVCGRIRSGCHGCTICQSNHLVYATPSWDPVIGTLGGVLDPKIVISCLSTEWSRREGLTSSNKD